MSDIDEHIEESKRDGAPAPVIELLERLRDAGCTSVRGVHFDMADWPRTFTMNGQRKP